MCRILFFAMLGITTVFFANARAGDLTVSAEHDEVKPDHNATQSGSAKDAWLNLVGQRFAKRPEFAFVKNDPAMPNVLIYGDSISIHYTQSVRQKLQNRANIYRLYCNGGDSSSFIEKMTKMHSVMCDRQLDQPWRHHWDVIQFNVGLHDLKYVQNGKLNKENGKQVSSIDSYKTKGIW